MHLSGRCAAQSCVIPIAEVERMVGGGGIVAANQVWNWKECAEPARCRSSQ